MLGGPIEPMSPCSCLNQYRFDDILTSVGCAVRPQAVNVPLLPTEGAKEGLPVVVGGSVLLPHLRPAFLRSRSRCFQRCHRGGERLAFLGRRPTFKRPWTGTSRRSRKRTRTTHSGGHLGRFFGVSRPGCIACCGRVRAGGEGGVRLEGQRPADGSIDQRGIDLSDDQSIGSNSHARISDAWPRMRECMHSQLR